jgi:TusE/DsrC/DsvC family sulfur relay protein
MNSTAASSPRFKEAINMESFLDGDGFFKEPKSWTPKLAKCLARQDGLQELTRQHWQIIAALREHFRRFGATPPAFAHLCACIHQDTHCVARLFHSEREAWRLAGLPDPGEEAKAYL